MKQGWSFCFSLRTSRLAEELTVGGLVRSISHGRGGSVRKLGSYDSTHSVRQTTALFPPLHSRQMISPLSLMLFFPK
jgi:hypothetical protein